MAMKYLGHLQKSDPLFLYLRDHIQKKLNLYGDREYRVFKLHASNNVYMYEETQTLTRLIGKFYYHGFGNREAAHRTMEQEYFHLKYMRKQGFDNGCHYLARPLGKCAGLNELLLEEYCYGEPLSSILIRSIRDHNSDLLYGKLTALAYFLSRFHNRTALPAGIDFAPVADYARGIAHTLHKHGWISDHRNGKFHHLIDCWQGRGEMYSDNQVIVHGDATPENFLFGDGLHVISYDLERMRTADRMYDVGRIVAELAHFFMLYAGSRFAAEPFIGHFLWEYSCHFPDRNAAFASITCRLPFYMGINFLRIARNSYFDWNYRQMLLNAASECLKGGLA